MYLIDRFISIRRPVIAGLALAMALMVAPLANAGSVTMQLTGAGNNIMGGVYVNPYTASINGVPGFEVFCNDFNSPTYINETWTAHESTFDDLSEAKWVKAGVTDALNLYNQVAWLTLQLMASNDSTTRGQISFAMWGIFTPTALNRLNDTNKQAAQGWIDDAKAQNLSAAMFSNFRVYTPLGQGTCSNGQLCGVPQEFLRVQTPEAPALWTLGLHLLGVFALLLGTRLRPTRV
ncbi:MAG: hypothetical protein IPM24_22050 [Bryobacterales bacterium]|nr:hypothetical protein [Bryobacterales bacterium]